MSNTFDANAFINLNKHPGEYNSQLGFSSNGHIYYRNFNNSAINSSSTWYKVYTEAVFNDNSANWNTAYTTANAALPRAGGTMTGTLRGVSAWNSSTLSGNPFYVENSTDGFGFGVGSGISTWWSWSNTAGLKRAIDVDNFAIMNNQYELVYPIGIK